MNNFWLFQLFIAAFVNVVAKPVGMILTTDQGLISCIAVDSKRVQLTVGAGRTLYIEPQSMASDGKRFFLAGIHSYVWSAASPARLESQDRFLGAMVDSLGKSRGVVSPLKGRPIRNPRVAFLKSGEWAVTFAEIRNSRSNGGDSTVAYWFGLTDGTRWKQLERLPAIVGTLDASASQLVQHGADISIAIPAAVSGHEEVYVFTRRSGKWLHALVQVGHVAYVALGTLSTGRLALGVVRADTTQSHDTNSFFLYAEYAGVWKEHSKLIAGNSHPIHDPDFSLDVRRPAMTWMESGRSNVIKAQLGLPNRPLSATLTISTNASQAVYLPIGSKAPSWVISERTDAGANVLAIRQLDGGSINTLASIPNPFDGPFAAAALGNRVFITGPVLVFEDAQPVVRSQFVAVQLRCKDT